MEVDSINVARGCQVTLLHRLAIAQTYSVSYIMMHWFREREDGIFFLLIMDLYHF